MAPQKSQTAFQSQMKITLALFILWNYLHVSPFDYMNNKKHRKKPFLPNDNENHKISICYYRIKVHEIYDIRMYFFFPEMLL